MADEPKTVPPPPGADDPYEASTVVGQAPTELLASLRGEMGRVVIDPPAPTKPTAPAPTAATRIAAAADVGFPPTVAILIVFAAMAAALFAIVR